ncbi:CHAT domain-containing protein [Chamaesiphon polymorphus]|uniref:CHAT domain-containing protein n=1 Tax=Chamaesiphon polymorphus CCALA 037 TaxID=2107692 RepID=A0A2T1GC81_9CYAN|nr:CHAT domain-containing tetratricopeptide repeat protein [Chamaesiphon polymorphus]PSB54986.1 hypothetical protein C7B77_16485 [Chamaesiphon polymorphus CCALA 037]
MLAKLFRESLPSDITCLYQKLSSRFYNFKFGDRSNNIEISIACCQLCLGVLTIENSPTDWAAIQNFLAHVFFERIRPERAENIEQAIACWQSALEVYTKIIFPLQRATIANIQTLLGYVYSERISGDKAENLEESIEYFKASLEMYTKENPTIAWAQSVGCLGDAYYNRIKGERADNLEKSIAYCESALEVYTKADFPQKWIFLQDKLARAYFLRIRGDKADNLEKSIGYCESVLEIYNQADFPQDWAFTQYLLAGAYYDRIRGNKADNLEKSIGYCESVLEIYNQADFPQDWALTQYKLGISYRKRIRGDKADNLEKSIAYSESALEVYTKADLPRNWQQTKILLAAAYFYRIKGDRAENLEKSIEYCRATLQVYTNVDFPVAWAVVQGDLALLYHNRVKGVRTENLEQAVACYEAALEICTPSKQPIECLRTSRNLGNLHFNEGNWQQAIDTYLIAITAVEQLRSWAMTDQNKQEFLEQGIEIYYNLIQSCINTQQYDKALEYAERSKSRNLVDLLANRDTYPRGEIAPEILASLAELRRQLLIAERQIQQQNNRSGQRFIDSDNSQRGVAISQSGTAIEHSDRLVSLKQELERLITTHIQPIDPSFQLTQKVEPISFEEMRSALPNDRTALVTWYIAQDKLLTFIVTPQATHPQLIESTPEAFQQFIEVLTEYQTAYSQYRERINKDWKQALPQYLAQFSQTLGLAEILQQLPPECDRLILIPHRFLHLIPLHALPIVLPDNTETCLLDRFPQGVRYAPSVQLLKLAQQWSRPPLQNLLAVQDPTQDLTFTNLEVTALRTHFQPFDRVFSHQAAQKSVLTPELLSQSNCVHFSCHGVFDFANPIQSALMMSESLVTTPDGQKIRDLEKCLTLGEIFTQDLRQCRLVTLSACETGIVDVSKQIDEYIGLPSGFLFAGSPSIVSSLWAVDDLSTTCLMIRFYNNLQQNDSVSIALNDAQRWLRQANGQEIKEMVTPWLAQSGIRPSRTIEIDAQLDRIEKESEPFAAPYHWAAFCAIGQ